MKRKRAHYLFFLSAALLFFSFSPGFDSPADRIAAVFSRWSAAHPQEKVYLHMDKPYYALGDTVWFKAYLTAGSKNQPSDISGILYVDLLNERDSVTRALKLMVRKGTAIGDFVLGDDYTEGNYRIRAYTQWMHNAGDAFFFDRTFSVGNGYTGGLNGRIAYSYLRKGNKTVVMAKLSFLDQLDGPLVNKELKYEVVSDGKVVGGKTVRTDEQGNLELDLGDGGADGFRHTFIRTRIVRKGKEIEERSFAVKAYLPDTDLQFFPEGGSLVNGLTSRVGFKSLAVDGSGVPVRGTVIDEEGKELLRFSALHAGMGSFELKPLAGKNYKARVTFDDGSEKVFNLPDRLPEGYVLSVRPERKDSLELRIGASEKLAALHGELVLAVQSAGKMIQARGIRIAGGETVLRLDKNIFPDGITQFTLFDAGGTPFAERMAFIRGRDQMELELVSDKKEYGTKSNVALELRARDAQGKPLAGNFSVSVVAEARVKQEEQMERTIFTDLLLTSDLKGYVEQPNYYFMAQADETSTGMAAVALDNLMLTQGYRRFLWKDILSQNFAAPVFKPEKYGMELYGQLKTLAGKPLENGKVALFSLNGGVMEESRSDAAGRFRFEEIVFSDELRFMAEARNQANSKKVELLFDPAPVLPVPGRNKNIPDFNGDIASALKPYLDNARQQDQLLGKKGQTARAQRLKEVTIRARKNEKEKYTTQGVLILPEGHADQTVLLGDAANCPTVALCLLNKLQGVIWKPHKDIPLYPYTAYNDPKASGRDVIPMDVVLDGRKLDDFELSGVFDGNYVRPADVARVEVLRTNMAAIGMLTGRPCLMIITKSGSYRDKIYAPNVVYFSMKGFDKPKVFYEPRYEKKDKRISDLRSTIYWNPVVRTSAEGTASIDFYNGDNTGIYKVTVEGIGASGALGRQVFRYVVKPEE